MVPEVMCDRKKRPKEKPDGAEMEPHLSLHGYWQFGVELSHFSFVLHFKMTFKWYQNLLKTDG